nr:reverse transcriptase domain-containing protein [Tanacetum cinerariifolium]
MADNQTMAQLLQHRGFFGHDKEDPHAHIRYFNKITSMMRVPNIPNSTIKLMLFPFSLEGVAQIWLEKEPPRSILTWDDLVSKFINQFFPPLKTTNLRNEITRFQQRFDESFSEAWDRFNDLLRACPHHGFSELHQLDTFYNALNINDQDSLNTTAGGNFLDKIPSDCLKIIESKSKVRQSRAKAVVAKVNSSSSTPAISSDVAELKDMVRALVLDKKNQSSVPAPSPTPAPVKAVESNCVTCGGTHSYQNCPATSGNVYQDNIQEYVSQATTANYNQGNTSFHPQMVAKQIRPPEFPPVQNNQNNFNRGNNFNQNRGDMSFEISFTDALILMPKFASTLKALIRNKEKLSEMARTLMNEHCSVVILNKLPKKLRDPGKFRIPCEFPGMDECLALADLGASIDLMPLSVWKELSLPKLNPTCITLELADRSFSKSIGIAKNVKFKVGMFYFPADFVVVDFEPDPRVPLILGRCFLKTGRALINVHKGELTLRIKNEAITYNLDQTSRYSANYYQITANKINVTDEACEEYSQEVLGFFDVTVSGSPTPSDDPIFSTTSPTLTPFGDSDFLLFEEANTFLGLEDDPDLPEFDPPWVSPVHCVPKKGGLTVVKNKENELIPTRLVTGWRDTPFIFSKDCIKAFQTLKQKLTKAPILISPNWDLPFELMCDASDFAIGAVLGQRYEKHFRPIHYASKTLTEAESNYTTTKKEMLSVAYAFEKFRSYLIMNKCIVHTDHSALKYLFVKKDAKARLLRWVLLLQEFNFDVLDTKRAKNLAADHLSRLENPYENVLDPKEINETFPFETLSTVTFRGDSSASWFADFANYHAGVSSFDGTRAQSLLGPKANK